MKIEEMRNLQRAALRALDFPDSYYAGRTTISHALTLCGQLIDIADAAQNLLPHLEVLMPAVPHNEKLKELSQAGAALVKAVAALEHA